MATYYIDPEWTGTLSGTFAAPYAAYSSLPSLSPGDFVLQKENTTFNGHISVAQSGTVGLPITFGVYNRNTGTQIVNQLAVARLAGTGSASSNFNSNTQNYITIMGFEALNTTSGQYSFRVGTAASANGCIVAYCKANNQTQSAGGAAVLSNPGYPGHIVTNCEFSYNTYGIVMSGGSGAGMVTFTNNICSYNAEAGIRSALSTSTPYSGKISGNICNYNGTISAVETKGMGIDSLSDSSGLYITNNQCIGNFSIGIRCGSVSFIQNAPYISGNVCNKNGQFGIQISRGVGWIITSNICNQNGANRGSFYGRGIEVYSSNGTYPVGPGIISYNTCNENYNFGGTLNNGTEGCGIGLDDNHKDVIVLGNTCVLNEGNGIQFNPTTLGGTTIVASNFLKDNYNAPQERVTSGWSTYSRAQICLFTSEPNAKIYNNTIIKTLSDSICLYGISESTTASNSGVEVVNNLIQGHSVGLKVRTGITRNNNAFLNNTKNVESNADTTTLSNGTNAVTTNMELTSNYIPKITSSLYQTGSRLSVTRGKNTSFLSPPSIGAYEYVDVRGTR